MSQRWFIVFVAMWCSAVGQTFSQLLNIVEQCPHQVDQCVGREFFRTLKTVMELDSIQIVPGMVALKRRPDYSGVILNEGEMDKLLESRGLNEDGELLPSILQHGLLSIFKNYAVVFKFPDSAEGVEIARQTNIRLQRFLLPLLLGIKLKLAAFVPFALSILAVIGKGAFLSGNAALFMSGLTIFLRYFYPKSEQTYYYKYGHQDHRGPTGYETPNYHQEHQDYPPQHQHTSPKVTYKSEARY